MGVPSKAEMEQALAEAILIARHGSKALGQGHEVVL